MKGLGIGPWFTEVQRLDEGSSGGNVTEEEILWSRRTEEGSEIE